MPRDALYELENAVRRVHHLERGLTAARARRDAEIVKVLDRDDAPYVAKVARVTGLSRQSVYQAQRSVTRESFSLSLYAVRTCSYPDARDLLARGHYLGPSGRASTWIGLYRLDVLVGVAGFGQCSHKDGAQALWKDGHGTLENTCELQRLYLAPGDRPHDLGSWFMARAVALLPDEVQMVVSFADPNAGHHGGLYQACGWTCTGRSHSNPYHYVDKDGKRVAKMTPWKIANRAGLREGETPSEGERRVASERGWTRVKDQEKHRYVFPRTRFARKHLRPGL